MGANDLLALANQFGPWAVLAAIMVWDKSQERAIAKERAEADKQLAVSLALLNATVQGSLR